VVVAGFCVVVVSLPAGIVVGGKVVFVSSAVDVCSVVVVGEANVVVADVVSFAVLVVVDSVAVATFAVASVSV